jgi:antitoxin component HigA of HigAB toxin-antitoxin module
MAFSIDWISGNISASEHVEAPGGIEVRPNTDECDRLDLLVTLAEAWEEKHRAIEPPDPVHAIELALE